MSQIMPPVTADQQISLKPMQGQMSPITVTQKVIYKNPGTMLEAIMPGVTPMLQMPSTSITSLYPGTTLKPSASETSAMTQISNLSPEQLKHLLNLLPKVLSSSPKTITSKPKTTLINQTSRTKYTSTTVPSMKKNQKLINITKTNVSPTSFKFENTNLKFNKPDITVEHATKKTQVYEDTIYLNPFNDHVTKTSAIDKNDFQQFKTEIETEVTEKIKSLETLKRRKRNIDAFDILHQSNACVQAYRICITRSKQYIVSKLKKSRNNELTEKKCSNNPARIVFEPHVNLCSEQNLGSTNFNDSAATNPSLTQDQAVLNDSLQAVVVNEESPEGYDYRPQNNPYLFSSPSFTRPGIFPDRIPPFTSLESEDFFENSEVTNDTIIYRDEFENLDRSN